MALLVGSSLARPLGGNALAGETAAVVVSDDSGLQLLQRLYLQNLQGGLPGPSCSTNSPNVKCPPPAPMG
ncbi:hypothetical protein CFC21_097011 [Triticum aestivum]|uniref:Uncharacterized protein n=4 Tax=Triticum TaxID=4564 RepID=A0A9R1BL43_TRITD|nr:hypothetical protein TRIUR3_25160 [Triticum urartu]KAF7094725.1 hypothetical protein CFC21_097011 [Triticum aestivum]VAI72664.1 unnamed protein product [Triticum turgidum subsp. durum]